MFQFLALVNAFSLVLCCASWAKAAEADPGRVAVLLYESATPTARRLEAEISDLNVRVLSHPTVGVNSLDARTMAPLALEAGANALVVLRSDELSATVWLWDASAAPAKERTVNAGTGSEELRSDALVVGIIELIRAHLLALNTPPEPPKPEPEPPPPPPEPKPPPPQPTSGPIAFAATVGPDLPADDWSWGLSYQLNLELSLSEAIGLRTLARLPIEASTVGAGTAKAEMQSKLLGGALTLDTAPSSSFRFGGHAGAGAAHLSAKGFSDIPARTSSSSGWVFVLLVGLHARWQFQPSLGVVAHAGTALAPNRAQVVLNDEAVALWGRPTFMSGLGLEFRPSFL